MAARAVVFAYHDVGVRCLSVLLAHGVEIPLVVTHRDDPQETIWFESVERLARGHGLEVATPDDPNAAAFVARVAALRADFLLSFYYRHMLSPALLASARRGAFNMHGSLLPKYRGRVPVNWAILNGERETGATLHEMVAKPDAGRIVDRMAVPILADDLAVDVFRKVTEAAGKVLDRALPRLIDGTATLTPQDLERGSYFGGRKPEDGRIDLGRGARSIHDLVRAVAPPYPGAINDIDGGRLRILRTRVLEGEAIAARPGLLCEVGRLLLVAGDRGRLEVLALDYRGESMTPRAFCDNVGPSSLRPAP
jgi:methionyl-tRNA formyltransferase